MQLYTEIKNNANTFKRLFVCRRRVFGLYLVFSTYYNTLTYLQNRKILCRYLVYKKLYKFYFKIWR